MWEAINLVNKFKVENVIFNCGPYNVLEQELIKVLDKKKIKYYLCIKELNIDNNKLYFLQTKEYDNSNVIYTKLDSYKFMFMGDAGVEKEKNILEKYNLSNIDVLKVGHHGSGTSSSKEFIKEIKPKYGVISVGKNNRCGHPNKEVLNNLEGSKIYRTDEDLMPLLEYSKWENFNNVIQKAVTSYKNSNNDDTYWLPEVRKPIITGKGKEEFIKDYKLSRYICYLIVQNANPKKKMVALGQTYFAIQTRKQKLSEKEFNNLTEDEKRLYRRNQARKGNYNLNQTAVNSGVKDLARFHNAGYKGLYNGETADDIFKRKKLRYREDILDNMGSEELADNIFRIAQTDAKLKRDNVDNEYTANSVHYEIGKKVRKVIEDMGGIMPENLPIPDKSLKELEKEPKK